MTRNVRAMAKALVTAVLASLVVAGGAAAQRAALPRQSKAGRSQLVRELAKLQQAQLAFLNRYEADDAFAGRLDDLMTRRDVRGAAAAIAEATRLPLQAIDVSADPAGGGGGLGATDHPREPDGFVLTSRAVRSARSRPGSTAEATATWIKGTICLRFIPYRDKDGQMRMGGVCTTFEF